MPPPTRRESACVCERKLCVDSTARLTAAAMIGVQKSPHRRPCSTFSWLLAAVHCATGLLVQLGQQQPRLRPQSPRFSTVNNENDRGARPRNSANRPAANGDARHATEGGRRVAGSSREGSTACRLPAGLRAPALPHPRLPPGCAVCSGC